MKKVLMFAGLFLIAGLYHISIAQDTPNKEEPQKQEQKQPSIVIPEGTTLSFKLDQSLSSKSTKPKNKFSGVVDMDVLANNQVAIPKGSKVQGQVLAVQSAGRLAGQAKVDIVLTHVEIKGKYYGITTLPLSIQGQQQAGKTARRVGAGAAVGAVFDGGKGAGRGAAVMGAASLLGRDGNITIPQGYNLQFQMVQALMVE